MHEPTLLAHIFERSKSLPPHVLVGPGDDCAVVRTPAGDRLVLKVDQLIESRHFTPNTPIDLIARKAIARALSDLAAMAAAPSWSLCAATLPPAYTHANELFDALHTWANHWSCPLVGGDIALTPGPLSLSITVGGAPHAARGPVLRSTAKPGDTLYLTGPIGNSFDHATGLGKHLTFEPRLRLARELADTLNANLTAMLDVSDGLGIDAGRLATASSVRIEIDADRLPLAPGLSDPLAAAAHGEDYELLFTASAHTPLATPIGRVLPGSGCFMRIDNTLHDIMSLGYTHSG